MADKYNLYGTSAGLGTSQSLPVPKAKENSQAAREERLTMYFRSGASASYPYHFISLIDVLSRGHLVLCCTCGNVEKIVIRGRNLAEMALALGRQAVAEIRESDRPEYGALESAIIQEIVIVHAIKANC